MLKRPGCSKAERRLNRDIEEFLLVDEMLRRDIANEPRRPQTLNCVSWWFAVMVCLALSKAVLLQRTWQFLIATILIV